MKALLLIMLLVAAALAGCGKDQAEPSKGTPTQTEKTGKAEAKAGVEPGSHEDWCEEHQVPESQCTLCDPKLAAAFKATGDWCEEHGLPESQCRKCNPDLKIERPLAKGN